MCLRFVLDAILFLMQNDIKIVLTNSKHTVRYSACTVGKYTSRVSSSAVGEIFYSDSIDIDE